MDSVELRIERLLERLARENRQLLALLRMGLPLRRAERVLDEMSVAPGRQAAPAESVAKSTP